MYLYDSIIRNRLHLIDSSDPTALEHLNQWIFLELENSCKMKYLTLILFSKSMKYALLVRPRQIPLKRKGGRYVPDK